MKRLILLIALLVLVAILVKSPAPVMSDTSTPLTDNSIPDYGTATDQTETSNSSASATITITMTGMLSE